VRTCAEEKNAYETVAVARGVGRIVVFFFFYSHINLFRFRSYTRARAYIIYTPSIYMNYLHVYIYIHAIPRKPFIKYFNFMVPPDFRVLFVCVYDAISVAGASVSLCAHVRFSLYPFFPLRFLVVVVLFDGYWSRKNSYN